MMNRNTFLISLFLFTIVLNTPQSHAAMQTFEKEYTYTASELDSKSSCRAIALEQVKRILLQELGVYVESVFNDKASTDGRTKDEVRREITTLSAGVASTAVVEEKWDGTTYWLKARIKADPDDVAKKIEALRQDKQKVVELEESRKRAEKLSQELERMRKELDATKSAAAKAGQTKQYTTTAQHLSAEDWFNKGHAFHEAKQYEQAIESFSKSIALNPKEPMAYYSRGFAYGKLGDYRRAIGDYNKARELAPKAAGTPVDFDPFSVDYNKVEEAIGDCSKAIELNPKYADAYYNRGVAYAELGAPEAAVKDMKTAARLGSPAAQDLLESQGIPW